MREEGEVFVYVGTPLPSHEIAVKAPENAPIGKLKDTRADGLKGAPEWTTDGFVKRANQDAGRDELDEMEEESP